MLRFSTWILLFLAVLVWTPMAGAESDETEGRISGRIVSAENDRALPYANIMLLKLASPQDTVGVQITGTFSLAPEGSYELRVAPGRYRLQVTHIAHGMTRSPVISVGAGQVVPLDVRMASTAALVLPTVEVRGTVIRNTEAAILVQQKAAEVVADAISAEQIKKTTDSNAAEALRRVSGLSLVDDKYVFVRGMGERYSSTQLNGATVGSPEPNKRVVPLDLIPANMLDNAWIVKTYSPEMPAEFGGGGVNINTRDFPGHKTWSLAITSGLDAGTTGRSMLTYDGGGLDFLGIDDGTRDYPDLFEQLAGGAKVTPRSPLTGGGFAPDTLESLGESFNKVWTTQSATAAPRHNLEGSYGNEIRVLGQPLGFMFGGVYKTSYDNQESANNTYRPGEREGVFEPNTEFDVTTSTIKHTSSLLGSLNYKLSATATLHLRSMLNRIAEDEARTYEGDNHDTGAHMRNTRLAWTERKLWASNAGMSHELPWLLGSSLEWRVDYSEAAMDEPDRREYNYEFRPDTTGGYWELSARGPGRGFTRMFGALEEEERSFSAQWRLPLGSSPTRKASLRLGYGRTGKDRDLEYRRLAFKRPNGRPFDFTLPPESLMTNDKIGFHPSKHFVLTELTRPEDSYRAGLDVTALYFVVDAPMLARLRLSGGLRMEDWRQQVVTRDRFASDPAKVEVDRALLDRQDWLPAVNFTYLLSEATNVRLGFSRTISRPDLRELSSFTMPDFDSGYETRGNPDLKRASILNYDLRVETYPRPGENLAVSLFYKDLTDPIENSLVSAGGQLRKLPVNADWAWLRGLEVEGRIGLSRLTERLRSLAVVANLTLTKSRAKVPFTDFSGETPERERPLQGQSPYLLNVMLFYSPDEHPYGCSLTYNAFGKRMSELGLGQLPDSYEQAYHSIDFAVDYRLGRYRLKLAAQNLLDREIRYTLGDYTAESWKDGRSYQLKIGLGG